MAIPIPKRPSGYAWGNADAPIQVEAFIDLECPFSKKGWTSLIELINHYSPQQIRLTIQLMTLSNHRQSWDATKAAIAVANGEVDRLINFVTYLFAHQEEYAEAAFKEKTQVDLHNLLARYAINGSFYSDRQKFIEHLNSKEVYNQARIPARWSIVRGVWSTPTFFINGAEATDLSSQSTLKDWQDTLEPLLA